MYRPGNKNMEDKENRRYESMEDIEDLIYVLLAYWSSAILHL
jgi:hypothetical protein